LRAAARSSGPRPIAGGGQLPAAAARGRGGGGGTAYGGLEMLLSPTKGVDFNSYLQRVIFGETPIGLPSCQGPLELGEKGIVVLTFKIMRDGSVPSNEPKSSATPGKSSGPRRVLLRARLESLRAIARLSQGPYHRTALHLSFNIPLESLLPAKVKVPRHIFLGSLPRGFRAIFLFVRARHLLFRRNENKMPCL